MGTQHVIRTIAESGIGGIILYMTRVIRKNWEKM